MPTTIHQTPFDDCEVSNELHNHASHGSRTHLQFIHVLHVHVSTVTP